MNNEQALWQEIRRLSSEIDKIKTKEFVIGNTVFNVKNYGAKGNGVTDDTARIQAAINAAIAVGGGTVFFPTPEVCYLVSGQLKPTYTGTPPLQKPLRLIGAGSHFTGGTTTFGPNGVNGGSLLNLTYSGTYGKILTLGHGLLEIANLNFEDTSGGTLPFIYGTNTTLHIHNNGFFGSKVGTNCDQDAIILGGTVAAFGDDDPTHGFQGYGTVIRENYFDGIRRAVYLRVYCNGTVIRDNVVWANCGSNLAGGACFEIDGNATDTSNGNYIGNNTIEVANYPYPIKVAHGLYNQIIGNGLYDSTATTLAGVRFEATAGGNIVIPGSQLYALTFLSDANGAASNNVILGNFATMKMGGQLQGADGTALILQAGPTNDHVYMSLYPRSAAPSTRGGFFGYAGGAATTDWYLENDLGDLHFKAKAGNRVVNYSPQLRLIASASTPTNGGTVTLDANTGNVFDVTAGNGVAAFTMAAPSNPYAGLEIVITVKNASGGALTVTWNAAFKLAWTDPANGYSRTITLRYIGTNWVEQSMTSTDIPN